MQGNVPRLLERKFRLDIRMNFFMERVGKHSQGSGEYLPNPGGI